MIIFMGVAGSGKSMQGRMLADKKGLPWLSTGEFLRMLVSGQKRIDMLSGKLLGDGEIIALVKKIFTIIDTNEEFILDGFPRTIPQVDWLLEQVEKGDLPMPTILQLEVSQQEVHDRLKERGRQDDTEEAIAKRFKEYDKQTRPIIEHLKQAGAKVHEIDGSADVETVHAAIMNAIGTQ